MPEPWCSVHPLVVVMVALWLGLLWAAYYCKVRPYCVRPYEVVDPGSVAEIERSNDTNDLAAQDAVRAEQEREFLDGGDVGSTVWGWAVVGLSLLGIGVIAELLQMVVGDRP